MKRTILLIIMTSIIAAAQIGFAEDKGPNQWEKDFVMALQKGKMPQTSPSDGLAYTPAAGVVLEQAIKKALEMQAPPCEAMKIAVDLKYDPYSILINIFGYGSQVNLNQLCGCATESGINKKIVAEAAAKAMSPLGKPIFDRDEIAQAQCLTGLGYTPYVAEIPRVERERKPPVSVMAPN
ncbi:MAG: hypothetical protein KKE62_04655 [Proteobacteria bacterium]|nr:hypothetical protein [Pseudomonadota bacterium]MBU1388053.1 hypothetical protein [Pseudomonadota bacterium]MBU1542116.1 hypothetical protein [Pseudomonadota bacterium]MBU2430100.1 hypothetical protein [Pseudomonadota bacterium]MBU2482380.1 hypothetical protein [Pseudomonadota bacterium]